MVNEMVQKACCAVLGPLILLRACSFQLGDRPPAPRKTFRMHWELRCEHLWYRSFYLFSFGEGLLSSAGFGQCDLGHLQVVSGRHVSPCNAHRIVLEGADRQGTQS